MTLLRIDGSILGPNSASSELADLALAEYHSGWIAESAQDAEESARLTSIDVTMSERTAAVIEWSFSRRPAIMRVSHQSRTISYRFRITPMQVAAVPTLPDEIIALARSASTPGPWAR